MYGIRFVISFFKFLFELLSSFSQYNTKGKVLPYSLLSVGPGADPGVQAVIPGRGWSMTYSIYDTR